MSGIRWHVEGNALLWEAESGAKCPTCGREVVILLDAWHNQVLTDPVLFGTYEGRGEADKAVAMLTFTGQRALGVRVLPGDVRRGIGLPIHVCGRDWAREFTQEDDLDLPF